MGQAKNRGTQAQRAEQAQKMKLATHPFDVLDDSAPVTVGMLRDSLDCAGQAVGYALFSALADAGLSRSQSLGIALKLHTSTARGNFHGPAGDVIAGIVCGMNLNAENKPECVGQLAQ